MSQILTKVHVLYHDDLKLLLDPEFVRLTQKFCGQVATSLTLDSVTFHTSSLVYYCGDVTQLDLTKFTKYSQVFLVKEFCTNIPENAQFPVIRYGEIPLNVHGMGVLVRDAFPMETDWYDEVTKAHNWQHLTVHNNKSDAHRLGTYLCEVKDNGNGEYDYLLMRCSTNFRGPTQCFQDVDRFLLRRATQLLQPYFKQQVKLNHILAQMYVNGQTKAGISRHADKDEDFEKDEKSGKVASHCMIVFISLYEGYVNGTFPKLKLERSREDHFDFVYGKGGETALTGLEFNRKQQLEFPEHTPHSFVVRLPPNSVLAIPLYTNNLMTHGTVASKLPSALIPTRLGIVPRTGGCVAKWRDGKTWLWNSTTRSWEALHPATWKEIQLLKDKYKTQNFSDQDPQYEEFFFSMNEGDYEAPLGPNDTPQKSQDMKL